VLLRGTLVVYPESVHCYFASAAVDMICDWTQNPASWRNRQLPLAYVAAATYGFEDVAGGSKRWVVAARRRRLVVPHMTSGIALPRHQAFKHGWLVGTAAGVSFVAGALQL